MPPTSPPLHDATDLVHGSRTQYKVGDGSVVNWSIGKQTTDVRMRAPQVMRDDLATSKVVDLKPKVPITLVRFKQCCIRVRSKILFDTNACRFVMTKLNIMQLNELI